MYSSIVLIGTGSLLTNCMRHVRSVCGLPIIYMEPEKKDFSGTKAFCETNNIGYEAFESKTKLSASLTAISQPTLVLSIHNAYIFPTVVLQNRELKIINFHNSLLPAHPGRNSPSWAIYDLDKETGITWHEVIRDIDKGNIICQRTVALTDTMTAMQATKKCVDLGLASFKEIFASLLNDSYTALPQTGTATHPMHYSFHVPNNGVFDNEWTFTKASAFLRAMDYGIFPAFDKPKIYSNDAWYQIEQYRLGAGTAANDDHEENKIVLNYNDGNIILNVKQVQ